MRCTLVAWNYTSSIEPDTRHTFLPDVIRSVPEPISNPNQSHPAYWKWLAPTFGLAAAVGYTLTNICLRQVAGWDPFLVAAVRAIPTILLVLPILGLRWFQGQSLIAPPRHVAALVGMGMITQVFGNVAFQWSLGVVGLAMSVPMVLGTMIIGSALIGRLILKEPIRLSTIIAIGLLLLAVGLLSVSAIRNITSNSEQAFYLILFAVAANSAAGFSYSALATVMRRSMIHGMSPASNVLILSLVGLIVLGGWSISRLGFAEILSVPLSEYQWMLMGGLLNGVSFLLLAHALRHLAVVYVHMINASQCAMAAFAGWLIFNEALTIYLVAGVGLTAAGLFVAGGNQSSKPPQVEEKKVPNLKNSDPETQGERTD